VNNEPKKDATSVWYSFKSISLTVVLVLVLILLFQNFQNIHIRVFFWSAEVSQLLVGFVVLIVGFLLGFFAPKLHAKRKQ